MHAHRQYKYKWVYTNNHVLQKSAEYHATKAANYYCGARYIKPQGKVSTAPPLPLYSSDGKMSTVPFNHLVCNHLVIIHLQRLAEADGKEEGEQQRERGIKGRESEQVNKTRNGGMEKDDRKRQKGRSQQPAIGS